MPSGYIYRSGPQVFDKIPKTSAAIAAGDALKFSSGSLVVGTAGAKSSHVSMETQASGTSKIEVIVTNPSAGRTKFLAYEKRASGSLAATDKGVLVDLSGATGAMGFDSSATSNKDFYLDTIEAIGAANVGRALVIFADPTYLQY